MAFGDLTSGVSMAPDNNISQGFQQMTSDLGQIQQAKSAQAQNKMKQFSDLANVSLNGMQLNDMDAGVAARDNMISKLAKWEATDGPMGLSWEHQKEMMGMKSGLEDMALQSQQSKSLFTQKMQEASMIKDPSAQRDYVNSLNAAAKLPITQRIAALENTNIPQITPSMTKALNTYPNLVKNRQNFNYKDAANVYKAHYESGNSDVTGTVDNYLAKNPGKTKEDAFNYMANLKAEGIPVLPTSEQKALYNANLKEGIKKSNLPSFTYSDATKLIQGTHGSGDKMADFTVGNTTYQKPVFDHMFQNANGEWRAQINYMVKPAGTFFSYLKGGQSGTTAAQKGTTDVPLSEVRSFLLKHYNPNDPSLPQSFRDQLAANTDRTPEEQKMYDSAKNILGVNKK